MTSNKSSQVAARGFLLHLCLRILSFVLSQLTIRLVDPTTLGRASIRLELGSSSALFLGREGFRLALLRNAHSTTSQRDEEGYSKDNIVWLAVPITFFLATLSTVLQLHHLSSSVSTTRFSFIDQRNAALLYCIAACIESCSEPIQMFCIWTLDITSRALAEGAASIMKASTLVILLRWGEEWFGTGPTTSFGIAQISYALTFTLILYLRKWRSNIPLPNFRCKVLFHGPTIKLSALLTLQSVFKHLLTEGDRIILTATLSDYDQGIYAMASSYGSIICRTIFQPLEENARWLFSSEASKLTQNPADYTNLSDSPKEGKSEQHIQVMEMYVFWVKMCTILSLPFACLAPNYAKIVLRIVAGRKWGDNDLATRTLASYCVYVFLLGLNGITEAFVYSTVGNDSSTSIGGNKMKASVATLTIVHAIIGLIFYISAPILVQICHNWLWTIPSNGLIYANCLSMVLRILFSFYFATSFFEIHRMSLDNKKRRNGTIRSLLLLLKDCSPHPLVLLSFISTFFITAYSHSVYGSSSSFESIWKIPQGILIHISIGIACGLSIIASIIIFEDKFLRTASRMFLGKIKRD